MIQEYSHPYPRRDPLWQTATSMGATCISEFDPDLVTHVIAAEPGTEKVKNAMKTPGVFLVNVDWYR